MVGLLITKRTCSDKAIREKRKALGLCIYCKKENDSGYAGCLECRNKNVEYHSDPLRKEKKRAYDRDRWDDPDYKAYRAEYINSEKYREYKRVYDLGLRETPEYKLYRKELVEQVRKSGRCPSCYRPLMMGEETKYCRLCSEKGDLNFKWN